VATSKFRMSTYPVIHVLTGCTAVGKTEAALQWAEAREAEIISCDSLLFYRGMDIGTAKPTKDELARVPHHLIDICEPAEAMDIARYVKLAQATVKQISARGNPILVTGGSGFYLKAFFGPVADGIKVTDEVRQVVAQLSLDEAVAELNRLNPTGLGVLDVANPRRVARALERCLASGRTVVELQADFAVQPAPFADFPVQLVELTRSPEELDKRIRLRVDLMIATGLVEEVERLLKSGLERNLSGAAAIGYREVRAMLRGEIAAEALADEIVKNTRALVKKQRTWFRTQLPEHSQIEAATCRPQELFTV